MAIRVSCKCGQQFAAKDELAGKLVKCPKCGNALRVGTPQPKQPAPAPQGGSLADLLDEAGVVDHQEEDGEDVARCPTCDAKMDTRAVLCVNCGYNVETGKFTRGIGMRMADNSKLEGVEGAADTLLKKAQTSIKAEKDEQKKATSEGMPIWSLAIMLSVIVTFAVGMSVLPTDVALLTSGLVCLTVCWLVNLVYHIKLLVIAYEESLTQFLLVLLVPFYVLIFVITRWSRCGRIFLIQISASVFASLGWGLVFLSPKFKKLEPGDPQSRLSRPPAAVVMADPQCGEGCYV